MEWIEKHLGLIICCVAVIGVIIGPWFVSSPYWFDWDFFDLSDKGSVGDTIGGITTPIIGLASVFLLYLTLREQIKINREQKKFNDATRILSIETFISKLENNITFGYSTTSCVAQGRGLSDLNLLYNNKVGIAEMEFEQLFNSIVAFQNNLELLYLLVNSKDTKLDTNQLKLINANLTVYYQQISTFYNMIKDDKITIYPVRKDSQKEDKDPNSKPKTDQVYKTYKGEAAEYMKKIPTITQA